MANRPRILVIGGGIGGLTAALALRRHGCDPTVYEAAPVLAPVGAGIVVAINGMQVYRRLGLEAAVEAAGARLVFGRSATRDLRALTTLDFRELETRHGGCGNVALHRARLQAVLVDALPAGALRLAKACVALVESAHGVTATFADGTTAEGDAAIAADGLHSPMRKLLFPSAPGPRFAGQTSWRGIARYALKDDAALANTEIWGGDGTRFGVAAVGHGDVYWFAVADAPPVPDLSAVVARYAPYVREIVAATPRASIVRTDISDLPHLPAWHRGRIALLGDAAHATTPNLGQGGNQAIEDALCVALAIEKHGPTEAAFASYFAARKDKARFIVDSSRRFGAMAHWQNPVLVGLRNALVRHAPKSALARQMDKVVTLTFCSSDGAAGR